MEDYEPSSAAALVNRLIDRIGVQDERGVVPFVRAWPEVVGRDEADHSQVLDVKNGTVLIGVDHPAWIQRMHMKRRRILSTIQTRFPQLEARNLAFSVVERLDTPWSGKRTPDQAPEAPETPAAPSREISDRDPAGGDDDLQQSFAALRRALEQHEDDEA